jgi:hypothetical protein
MSIKVEIQNAGLGKPHKARVDEEGQLHVIVHPHPPRGEQKSAIPYRNYFVDIAGSNDMLVDGSSTSIDFCIQANETQDIYVKTASIVLSDASQTLSEMFNFNGVLTNGVTLKWISADLGTVVIADSLKTNFDFIRLALGTPAFGSGATSFLANNISGNSEGYIPVIDFSYMFGLPYGIRLRAGTTDKLVWTVNDNLTAADQFDIIGYGLKI